MQLHAHKYTHSSGIYACGIPDESSRNAILQMVQLTNPPFSLEKFQAEAHMTLIYCRTESPLIPELDLSEPLMALAHKFEFWPGHDDSGYVVLKCFSKPASVMHDAFIDAGACHGFSDYTPHISIAHRFDHSDMAKINDWLKRANAIMLHAPLLVKFDVVNVEDCKQD